VVRAKNCQNHRRNAGVLRCPAFRVIVAHAGRLRLASDACTCSARNHVLFVGSHTMSRIIAAFGLVCALTGSPVLGADNPYAEESWLREGLAAQIPKFKRATLTPSPGQKGIVAANCETDLAWHGELRVFHQTGDKIDWIASFPPFYLKNENSYILSCDWHYLSTLNMWVLEVFDSSHKGNGSLWLFALEGHEMRVLLQTQAVGSLWEKLPKDLELPLQGRAIVRGAHLSVDYQVPAGAEHEAVSLTGTIAVLDQLDKEVSTASYKETWT
jgi:hypothetical protein